MKAAISLALRFVSALANLQPKLPVQATSPARIEVARVPSPIAAMAEVTGSTSSSLTPEIIRFCQTVRRMSPSPERRAISASDRIWSVDIRPVSSVTPM